MKKVILIPIIMSFVIVLFISMPWASNKPFSKNSTVYLNKDLSSAKIVLSPASNTFIIEDDLASYNMFDLLMNQLFKGSKKLSTDKLEEIQILSIFQQYTDIPKFTVNIGFKARRCINDVSNICSSKEGISVLEILLANKSITENLALLTSPKLSLKNIWEN